MIQRLENIWFTRCPVPTASGIAFRRGHLQQAFARDGITVKDLREAPREQRVHHLDHRLTGLFREGGNIPALAARASGADTRLIALTWIEESQAILVRHGSDIRRPEDLVGRRVALPGYSDTRGGSIARGMTIAGIKGALASVGRTLDDVTFVETPPSAEPDIGRTGTALWSIDELASGEVDAVYVKGAAAVEAAHAAGVEVGIDLDALPDPRFRINNGTPRPITVSTELIAEHFDIVVRFLVETLAAADWATAHPAEVAEILQGETRAGAAGVAAAYRNDFHRSLHPDLSDQRVDWLKAQARLLWVHGFLEHDVDVDAWIDRRPLEAALAQRSARAA